MASGRGWKTALVILLAVGVAARAQETSAAPAVSPGAAAQAGAAGEAAANQPAVKDDKKGGKKGEKKKKEKPPKLVPMSIVNGTLTMDGVTGKAELNYDIADLHYLYIWAPGVGTVVISNKEFAGAAEQKKGFSMNAVDVTVDDHKLEIYSDQPLFDKRKEKELVRDVGMQLVSAWVRVDKEYALPTPYPAMGYGMTANAPYAWPGAKPPEKRAKGVVTPPPVPVWMRPATAPAGATQPATPTPAVKQ